MTRLIVTVVVVSALVAFALANTHHVDLSLVIGAPIKVRQIFLLASAAGIGVSATLVTQQLMRARRRREALLARERRVRRRARDRQRDAERNAERDEEPDEEPDGEVDEIGPEDEVA